MTRISSLFAAGAFAFAAVSYSSHPAAAADETALTTEFSAQREGRERTTTTRTTTRPSGAQTRTRTTTGPGGATTRTRTTTGPGGATTRTRTTTGPQGGTTRTRAVTNPSGTTTRRTTTTTRPSGATRTTTTVRRAAPPPRTVTFAGPRNTFTATRARAWSPRGGTWVYAGRPYSYWRGGPWRVRYDNGWRTFVALSVVAPIAVGAATYYPYAYVSAPADVCEGITEDGCQLTWTEVELVEGGTAPQCVTYCPWQ